MNAHLYKPTNLTSVQPHTNNGIFKLMMLLCTQ